MTRTDEEIDITKYLPGECLAHIISFTSPADAGRSSSVSRSFHSAADSDQVWNRFLPSDYEDELTGSSTWAELSLVSSKKELYLRICDNPVLIDNGTMSFGLEKQSGKKCYMIGARGLAIIWGDTHPYWSWRPSRFSRFEEVAELDYVWWFDIKGRIQMRKLSPMTNYGAYFVFKMFSRRGYDMYGFRDRLVELGVNVEGRGSETKRVCFINSGNGVPKPYKEREDGWLEIEMGDFFNRDQTGDFGEDDSTLLCSVMETDCSVTKEGLLVYGIELRPK